MPRWKVLAAACAVLATPTLLCGCREPIGDQAALEAIHAEAQMLMKMYPAGTEVAKGRLPGAIASLKPELVLVAPDGVHITTTAYFDGGWGYFVPRVERGLPEPVERFEELRPGVYWWRPG